ncbi:MAG: glutathione synthase [Pseudomonadota bacterium]|nr:glutathione synthase [Pseudomonadota bacterium]
MEKLKIAVIMDPIEAIASYKDSTLSMLRSAQAREHELFYFTINDLRIASGKVIGASKTLKVFSNDAQWYEVGTSVDINLADLDVVLMRKDPPFNMEYIYVTYMLDLVEEAGVLVVNRPSSLRNINEKAFISWFPECCPETLVTRSKNELKNFRKKHEKIVVKPLDGMGGAGVFVISKSDNNANVIFETLTNNETQFIMAQGYIPEIKNGDKRIILINGEAPRYSLARIPDISDNRGNLAMGAKAEIRELTDRDLWICKQVGPELRRRGVIFAGLDVIGDYLTEVNVTSPTGIREISDATDLNLAEEFIKCIEKTKSIGGNN